PPIGRTAKQVAGFRGRSGRNFRAKLKIEPRGDEEGKWKVDFDEEWAKEPPPAPDGAPASEAGADGAGGNGADADSEAAAAAGGSGRERRAS
ncbi:MAG: hypothetical protein H0U24_00940, partial [Thermoleophilaceae bacterium]|nr:hypothetical protein [Thermoleophilaceae bacterium]